MKEPSISFREITDYIILPCVLLIGYFLKEMHMRIKEIPLLKERIIKLEISHTSIKEDLKELKLMLQEIIKKIGS